jgi:acyl carrier protein
MEAWTARDICCIVADQLGVDPTELAPNVSLVDDLAADSLDLLELAAVLEAECEVVIPDRRLREVRTYADLLQAVSAGRRGPRREERAPVFARARVVPDRDHGASVERSGELDPYTVEIIVEDVMRAGPGARLEIEVRGDARASAAARARFGRLLARGVEVSARPAEMPPAA